VPIQFTATPATAGSLQDEVEELEKQRIRMALAECGNNQVKTARKLGLSRQGLINKLKRYQLAGPLLGDAIADESSQGDSPDE
jgi:DNA-binding NtrC family response regulator